MKQVNKYLDLSFFTKRNIIFILIIVFFLSIKYVGVSKIVLGFFYFKNGSYVIVNDYKIEFPFSHWAYFGENNLTYVVAGRDMDSKNLSAEFFKDTEKINILKVISNCDIVKSKKLERKNIKGRIYLCMRNKTETMYFQSDDKKIFIRETDYNSSNMKIVEEYELLVNSISRI